MKIIVGLGNPGQKYENTRHNIGFVVLDRFLENNNYGTSFDKEGIFKTEDCIFLKPQTYMNRSGDLVQKITNFYKIPEENILVIHDDIDLPTAKIQIKLGGSPAGHNGLKDIITKIGSKEFWRLRIGIDRPTIQDEVSDYVLSPFKPEEKEKIADQRSTIEEKIKEFLK